MKTKTHNLLKGDHESSQSSSKFSNFNLNQNHKCSNILPLTSVATSKPYCYYTYTEKRDSSGMFSWEKCLEKKFNNELVDVSIYQEKDQQKRWMKAKMNESKSSTLSLHISAYETAQEISAQIQTSMPSKPAAPTSSNRFEFPRQMDDDGKNQQPSQIMQFKASQKLLTPNQGTTEPEKPPSASPPALPLSKDPPEQPLHQQPQGSPSIIPEDDSSPESINANSLLEGPPLQQPSHQPTPASPSIPPQDESSSNVAGSPSVGGEANDAAANTAKDTSKDSENEDTRTRTEELFSLLFTGQKDAYRVEEVPKLGQGGYGKVVLAESLKDKKKFAIKIINKKIDAQMEKEVLQRATNSSAVHLQKMFDWGNFDGTVGRSVKSYQFFVLELHGCSLVKFLQGSSINMKVVLLFQALTALEELHNLGYKHNDLKVDNYLMGKAETPEQFLVVLSDFGHCTPADANDVVKVDASAKNEILAALGDDEPEGESAAPKMDIIDFAKMMEEMLQVDQLDVEGDRLSVLKEETWKSLVEPCELKAELVEHLAKIFRYIESLKPADRIDFSFIYYCLKCFEKTLGQLIDGEYVHALNELENEKDKIEKLRLDFGDRKEAIKQLKKNCTKPIDDQTDLVFYSKIELVDGRKDFKNLQYYGYSLNQFRKQAKKDALYYGCTKCSNTTCFSVKVRWTGTEKTWERATLIPKKKCENYDQFEEFRENLKKCKGLRKVADTMGQENA